MLQVLFYSAHNLTFITDDVNNICFSNTYLWEAVNAFPNESMNERQNEMKNEVEMCSLEKRQYHQVGKGADGSRWD